MKKFIQHVPPFVDCTLPPAVEWTSQEELVLKLSELGYGNGVGKYFELSGNTVMEVSDNGYHWWVAGRVTSTEGLTFDKWSPKEKPKLVTNPDIKSYNASEVTVWCGDKQIFPCDGDFVSIGK